MKYLLKSGTEVCLHLLDPVNGSKLLHDYLVQLSPESKSRFGPHSFDLPTIEQLFTDTNYTGYVASHAQTASLLAYAVVKQGFLDHDYERLISHGITPSSFTDATIAPSVADNWQSQGLGNALFNFACNDLKQKGIRRLILWGGVQSSNFKAVGLYTKQGFRIIEGFAYNGHNWDMVLDLQ